MQQLPGEYTTGNGQEQGIDPIDLAMVRLYTVLELRGTPDETHGDPRLRAFYQQAPEAIQNRPRLSKALRDLYDSNADAPRSPSDVANSLFRSVQAIVQQTDDVYPHNRERPEDWDSAFEQVVQDEHYRDFCMNLRRNVMSNKPDRGKGLFAAIALHGRNQQLNVLEVGCSAQLIQKKMLTLSDNYRYDHLKVVRHHETAKDGNSAEDHTQTQVMNYLLRQSRLKFGQCVGIDVMNPREDAILAWIMSCSFKPEELLRPREREEAARLAATNLPNLAFHMDEFGPEFDLEAFQRRFPEPFDVVMFPTMLYQNQGSPDTCQRMLELGEQLAKPDGLVVVQDYVTFESDGSMRFHEDWGWNYGTWAKDLAKKRGGTLPSEGYSPLFVASDGRQREIALLDGLSELAIACSLELVPPKKESVF